jgi:hypothetical protein
MFQSLHASLLRKRLLRVMGFFFLILTTADVVFPPPCCEANEIPSAAQRLSAQGISAGLPDHTEVLATNHSGSNQSPEKGCCGEDCCFACAHVLSAMALTEDCVFDLKSTSVTMADRFVSEPPLRSPYHPPRFA